MVPHPPIFHPDWLDAGIAHFPLKTDGSKKPAIKEWKYLMTENPSMDELERWWNNHTAAAIVCKDGREAIDLETPEIADDYLDVLSLQRPDIFDVACIVRTGGGGVHLHYICDNPTGVEVFARDEEGNLIAEKRGVGNYVVSPGSDPSVHETGRPYVLEQGDILHPPHYTDEQRTYLHDLARSFNRRVDAPKKLPAYIPKGTTRLEGQRVGDDFNANGNWNFLPEVNWTHAYTRRDGVDTWCRPDKSPRDGISATTDHIRDGVIHVFSSNAPLELGAYERFTAYALLKCNGDFAEATRQLAAAGYGTKMTPYKLNQLAEAARVENAVNVDEDDDPFKRFGYYIDTDACNAHRFLEQHADTVRYVKNVGWFVWNGLYWHQDDAAAFRLAMQTVRSISAIEARDPNIGGAVRLRLIKWAVRSQSESKIRALLAIAENASTITCTLDDFDKDPYALNVKNGLVDLRTGQLHDHDQLAMCTSYIDLPYKPDSDADEWQRFISAITLEDDELADYIQRSIGYSLTGSTSCTAVFFCFGEGHNGKSTLIETFTRILAGYATGMRKTTLMHKQFDNDGPSPGVAKLIKKRWVAVDEIDDGDRLNEALVKSLSGGDSITARFLNKNESTFKPTHHLWMMGNHRPRIKNMDEGIWRRLHLIPFDHDFTGIADTSIKERFLNDRDTQVGILAWAIQGATRWHQQGGKLPQPQRVLAATAEYRADMDLVQQFIDAECHIGEAFTVDSKLLRSRFAEFCSDYGYRMDPSAISFGMMLTKKKGIRRRKSNGEIWYDGIDLRLKSA